MKFININCPECGLEIEYWTKNDFIECTKCKNKIKVEPCEDIEEKIEEDEVEEITE
jgi:DNA-directed RNA polymerase subunit RPC12/RpoP